MKSILLLFLLIGCFGELYGGNDTTYQEVIIINPFGKNSNFRTKYKEGTTIKFKIENVNFLKVADVGVEILEFNYSFDKPLDEKVFKKSSPTPVSSSYSEMIILDDGSYQTYNASPPNQQYIDKFIKEYYNFKSILISIDKLLSLESELRRIVGDDIFIKNYSQIQQRSTEVFNSIYGKGEDLSSKINSLRDSFIKLGLIYKQIDINENIIEEIFSFAREAFHKFEDKTQREKMFVSANAGKELFYKIDREDFFIYTDAIQLNHDVVTLTPKLKSLDDNDIYTFEPITFKTYNTIQVNFSTGYMLSFIGNDEYTKTNETESNLAGVKEIERNYVTHSLGALAHVMYDWGKPITVGLSPGLSLDTQAKVNFFMGLSFAFTENNRLVLTGGVSFVNIKKLDRSNLNDDYKFINQNDTEIEYNEVYKPAPFIGITYNLK